MNRSGTLETFPRSWRTDRQALTRQTGLNSLVSFMLARAPALVSCRGCRNTFSRRKPWQHVPSLSKISMLDGARTVGNTHTGKGTRYAVLVDADNTQISHMQPIMEELEKFGTSSVRRVYGAFSGADLDRWKKVALDLSFRSKNAFDFTETKASSGTAQLMSVDAMDLLYTNEVVEGFALVSSTCDFTCLAQRLREAGKHVLGVGGKSTPKPFVTGCDEFIYMENLGDDEQLLSVEEEAGNQQQAPEIVRRTHSGHDLASPSEVDSGVDQSQSVPKTLTSQPSIDKVQGHSTKEPKTLSGVPAPADFVPFQSMGEQSTRQEFVPAPQTNSGAQQSQPFETTLASQPSVQNEVEMLSGGEPPPGFVPFGSTRRQHHIQGFVPAPAPERRSGGQQSQPLETPYASPDTSSEVPQSQAFPRSSESQNSASEMQGLGSQQTEMISGGQVPFKSTRERNTNQVPQPQWPTPTASRPSGHNVQGPGTEMLSGGQAPPGFVPFGSTRRQQNSQEFVPAPAPERRSGVQQSQPLGTPYASQTSAHLQQGQRPKPPETLSGRPIPHGMVSFGSTRRSTSPGSPEVGSRVQQPPSVATTSASQPSVGKGQGQGPQRPEMSSGDPVAADSVPFRSRQSTNQQFASARVEQSQPLGTETVYQPSDTVLPGGMIPFQSTLRQPPSQASSLPKEPPPLSRWLQRRASALDRQREEANAGSVSTPEVDERPNASNSSTVQEVPASEGGNEDAASKQQHDNTNNATMHAEESFKKATASKEKETHENKSNATVHAEESSENQTTGKKVIRTQKEQKTGKVAKRSRSKIKRQKKK